MDVIRKLVVEVVEARDLPPIDGTGSSSTYVVADFRGQRKRTKTAVRTLNPAWNEVLRFDVRSEPSPLDLLGHNLEIALYHDRSVGNTRRNNFLGCIKVQPCHFVKTGEEALVHYKLRPKGTFGWLFTQVKGEIGIKIYYQDEPVQPEPDPEPSKPDPDPEPETKTEPEPPEPEPPKPEPEPPKENPPPAKVTIVSHPTERSSFDLVDKMHYLFVRIVKARGLSESDTGDPRVKIVVSGNDVVSLPARKTTGLLYWEQTFAFARETPDSNSILEISVWDEDELASRKEFLGGICFDTSEITVRDPPDSPLAPQWYRLEGGGARSGDLMLATWVGTQADESFAEAWKAETGNYRRAKVYVSPKLWYLRVTVIECQEVNDTALQVKAQLGFQVMKTKTSITFSWNEDLIFVASDQLPEDHLVLFLESRSATIGVASLPLTTVERRVDERNVSSRWVCMEDVVSNGDKRSIKGRLHVRLCFDGGYHVMDEAPHSCSDYLPSARQLWKPPIGVLELGVVCGKNLLSVEKSTDAYVVIKYGPKWVRTRTVASSVEPTWNEQYTWQVYDLCTVASLGVFDENGGVFGKLRIRISTLQAGRVYRSSYPLLFLTPTGLRKTGEIELAVRFVQTAPTVDVLHVYSQPLLPSMHHIKPMKAREQEILRSVARKILADHLSRSEPPLKREVVFYMLDDDTNSFSMRKVRANWRRVVNFVTGVVDFVRRVENTRSWKHPTSTLFVHALLLLLVCFPDLVIPTGTFYLFVLGVWNYRFRARELQPYFCAQTSLAEMVDRDELDEEYDVVPSQRPDDVVRARYDKLRMLAVRVQMALGDVAAQGERMHALMTWRDPRATGIFVGLCLVVALILYLVPTKMATMAFGFYYLRHPMFRDRTPSPVLNFFRRLPSLSDRML